jgi:hypothetical protein
MPTDIWKIPLDSNGCVRGTYRLRHKTEVSDTLGVVTFDRGLSEPITGQPLIHFVVALGEDVDLVPDDDEARAALGVSAPVAPAPVPAAVPVPEPPPVVATADTEPAPAAEAEPDEAEHQRGKRPKR